MDVITAANVRLTQRNHVLHDGWHGLWYAPGGRHTADSQAGSTFHELDLLGRLERVELGQGAAQPDVAGGGVDQVEGDQPPVLPPVFRLDDQMRDRATGRIDDHAAHLATRTIRAAGRGPDRELRLCCHAAFPYPDLVGVGWLVSLLRS